MIYHVSCRCGIEHTVSGDKEPNRAWLRFLATYDRQTATKHTDTGTSGTPRYGPASDNNNNASGITGRNTDKHNDTVSENPIIDTYFVTGAQNIPESDEPIIDDYHVISGSDAYTDAGTSTPVSTAEDVSPGNDHSDVSVAQQYPARTQTVSDTPRVKSKPKARHPSSAHTHTKKSIRTHMPDTSVHQVQPDAIAEIRSKSEIADMISRFKPDKLVQDILHTRRDYVCWYSATESQDTPLSVSPENLNLDVSLIEHLHKAGISRLYRFQHESFDVIVSGKDAVIVAPTASGKTEAFLIPLLQMISETRNPMTALIVYPTKALAKDQYSKIHSAAHAMGITLAIFDGDTPPEERKRIIASPPHILLTNFDIINYHLYNQTSFASLLHSVRILVVDEVHSYSGVFGSNVYYVIKRLNRLTRHRLQIIAASATIQEPDRFCSILFDRDITLISSTQRRGRMDMMILYPSDRTQLECMVDMASRLTGNNHKTLLFNNTHRSAEMMALRAKRSGIDIMVHRAGLTYAHRQKAEERFRNGNLMAISCTPTLELGIDIGMVDAVVSAIVPINRLMQRVGRAARRGQRGYAILVLSDDPISQYYKSWPSDYFEDHEVSYIDPKNPFVEEYHVSAMACDAPLLMADVMYHESAVQNCIDMGLLDNRRGVLMPNRARIDSAFANYNIRGTDRNVAILVNKRKVGDRAMPMALGELHPGAVYLMAGVRYRVKSLNWPQLPQAELILMKDRYPYHTKPHIIETPSIQAIHDTKTAWGMQVAHCTLHITRTFVGYQEFDSRNEPTFVAYSDTPIQHEFVTKGVVFCIPAPDDDPQAPQPADVYADACHATEHVIIEGGIMIIGGAARDLGGLSVSELGAIFVYDNAMGGNGASRALYDRIEAVIQRGKEILRLCPCKNVSGCPRCTYSYRCDLNNEGLNKMAALDVLTKIVDGKKSILNVSSISA